MEKLIIILAAALCVSAASVPETQVQERIANGQLAADTQFRYSVSLQILSEVGNATRDHRCGGVLVTLLHALTAASCTYDQLGGVVSPIQPSEFRVFAGSAILSNDGPDRVRGVSNFTIHPEHVPPPASINDIAVITLVAPFLATVVTPLSLPSSNFAPADLTPCTVAGWGGSTIDGVGNALRFTNKYIYNQALCTSVFASLAHSSNVFSNMVCAASLDIVSAGCPGDTGSALVCNDQLTGILFFTNNCVGTSFPELYTRVSNYTTWVRSVTGGASSFKPALNILAMLTAVQIVFMKLLS